MVIGLVAAVWISLMVIAVVLCRMAGRSDDASASAFIDRDLVRAELMRRAATPPAARESGPRTAPFPH
jgi:hypothetical protein